MPQSREWTSPRNVAIASVCCVVIGAIACGTEAAPVEVTSVAGEPTAAESVAVSAALDVAPAHGGTVVAAGRYPVEVLPHESGEIYAYVLGDAPPPYEETELAVVVPVTGGVRTVALVWDPSEGRWAGRVRRVEIVAGPIDVVLVVGGSRWLGHATTVVILPAIVVVSAPAVVVVEHSHRKHRKHRKHRGHHGHDD